MMMTTPNAPAPTTLKREFKPLLALTIPILITQFSQTGMGFIDTIMAGQLSPQDLAAIAVAVGLWIPIMLLFCGIIFATTPLVAKAVGEKNTENVVKITQHALCLAFALGVIALLILQFVPLVLHLFDVPETLIPKASLFLHAIGFGMPAVTLYTALRCYSEALGFPKPVTLISIAALFVLVPLNIIFMYGIGDLIPALGSAGCGFATAILQWLMLATLIAHIKRSKNYQKYELFRHRVAIQWRNITPIIALGLPIGLSIFFEVSLFSTAALVLSPLGESVIAAHQVTMSITSILFMIPMSLALALTIRVGHYYGQRFWQGMAQVQILGFIIATMFAILTMLLIWFARPAIIAIYTQDPVVTQTALFLVLFAMAYQLVDAWQVCAAGCLRGMQDTQIPMWITLFAYWGVAFPTGFYLVRYSEIGASGIWIGFIVGLSVASILLIWRLFYRFRYIKNASI